MLPGRGAAEAVHQRIRPVVPASIRSASAAVLVPGASSDFSGHMLAGRGVRHAQPSPRLDRCTMGILDQLIPEPRRRTDGRGRPWKDRRSVLNGILWVLRTGAPWADLPDHYPSYQTCHRRFQGWVRSGTMKRILESLSANLRLRRDFDLREAFIGATFAPAKKGGLHVGKTKRGKGTKIKVVVDRHGLPVAASIASASPHEVTLVGQTLAQMIVSDTPEHLVGDNAYDWDKLDAELSLRGVKLIAPHRSNRRHKTQDGRALRRYRRRWKIERLFAWVQNFRSLVVRYESHADNFLGMVHLAVALILLRRLL